MEESHILRPLNDAQRKAVTAPPGPILVLAGAGSGKTRALVHRITWLVESMGVRPWSIIAMTFTNKAAKEMRSRVEELLGMPATGLWIGTFHSLGLRMLRLHREEAGLPEEFEVIDTADQLRQVKKTMEVLRIDEKAIPPRQVAWRINSCKDEGHRAHNLPEAVVRDGVFSDIYREYEKRCQQLGLVDFGELLLRTYELLKNNQTVREHYQSKFEHVLIDEFQDTNQIQFLCGHLLSQAHQSIFAVGDDDQSIYGWRGARVENMLGFERIYSGATVFRLEQNYRSSSRILNAANAIIHRNSGRLGKDLWTDGPEGDMIRVYCGSSETDEARFVIGRIESAIEKGESRREHAILYRSNAQSRAFEEQLLSHNIPYAVYGGMRFFERAEIKNAIAYLRLAVNRDSDPSFDRVVNMPPRGIGDRTLDIVRDLAARQGASLWQASRLAIETSALSARASGSLKQFMEMIEEFSSLSNDLNLDDQVDHVIKKSGLLAYHQNERGEAALSRIQNLKELITAAKSYSIGQLEEGFGENGNNLSRFLSHTALEPGERGSESSDDCVQLMSLHSAKGLEFQTVYLCGMEEGLFPHQLSVSEGNLEEERRLCYVGITRAMRNLYLCHARSRYLYGRPAPCVPSRFLSEIPRELVAAEMDIPPPPQQIEVPGIGGSGSVWTDSTGNALELGCTVHHDKFGEGTIIQAEGRGDAARVQIHFSQAGPKWLVCAYARLRRV